MMSKKKGQYSWIRFQREVCRLKPTVWILWPAYLSQTRKMLLFWVILRLHFHLALSFIYTLYIYILVRKKKSIYAYWILIKNVIWGFFFLSFLGPHQKFSCQGLNLSYSCMPIPQPQQCQIWAMSVTHTTAHGYTRSLTHWAGPGIKAASSWILIEFIISESQWELLLMHFCLLQI